MFGLYMSEWDTCGGCHLCGCWRVQTLVESL